MNTERISKGRRPLAGAFTGAVLSIGILCIAPPAGAVTVDAEVDVDTQCVRGCVSDLRTCVADAREAFVDCSLEGGCVELAASARLACKLDKTASVCLEARAEYNDCIKPCRTALRTDVKSCQNDSLACLNGECGLSDLPEQCFRIPATVN